MNVIGHDYPGEHLKAQSVVMEHRDFGQGGNARVAEETFAKTAIQVFLQLHSLFAQSNALRSGV
jgi:hypothetical protein